MKLNYKSKETSKEDENKLKVVYFKVSPVGDKIVENLSFNLSKLKNEKVSFGEFNDYILIHNVEPELAVLEFFPKSKDVDTFAREYETCEQALDAAIIYLKNEKGLNAVPFDLEKLVNKIKIKPNFKNNKGLFVDYS